MSGTSLREFTVDKYLIATSVLEHMIAGCGTGDDELDEMIRCELAVRRSRERAGLS